MSRPPVYLVDASVYLFRAWFSMPDDFVNAAGQPTNAVYGFTGFLCNLLEQTASRHVAVAFDVSLESSHRNEIFPDYKANRDPAPEELRRQFQQCRRFVRALGVMEIASPRYEADDLIVDTHGADVIPDVWAILESAFEIFGVFPVLLERDFNLPPLAELLREVERIAQLQRRWTERADGRRQPA